MATIDLERFLPYRLNRVAALMSRRFRTLYRDRLGLTVPEWRVLATLAQFGTTTATAIGSHSDMHKAQVSRAVTALTIRGFVQRENSPEDGRIERLSLTRKGERAYADVVPVILETEKRLIQTLGQHEANALFEGLEKLEKLLK